MPSLKIEHDCVSVHKYHHADKTGGFREKDVNLISIPTIIGSQNETSASSFIPAP